MKKRDLVHHKRSNNSTYGFNLLNDKQKQSISGKFDYLHCAIDEDGTSGKVLLRNGDLKNFKLSLIGIKN